MSRTRTRNLSFASGEVVERIQSGVSRLAGATIAAGTLGTICRVVNAERSYMVRYADVPVCVLVYQDSIRRAPRGSHGPECEHDC
jgi:hypothetical protein